MRKYGLTIDLKHNLLKGPHGDMPLYELEGKDCLLQTIIEEGLTNVINEMRKDLDPKLYQKLINFWKIIGVFLLKMRMT